MLEAMVSCGRWSNIMIRIFGETESRPKILEQILSISVVELLLTLAGCLMCGNNIWEERQSKNSLVGA